MEFTHFHSTAAACVSGVAAFYWCCFSCLWARTYTQAWRERKHSANLPASKASSHAPFHIGVMLYQLLSILFYSANCVYEAQGDTTRSVKLLNEVCFTLYIPAAYVVGMSYAMGFGTLYTRIPWVKVVVLVTNFITMLLACCLSFIEPPSANYSAVIIFICAFFLQLLVTVQTIYLIKRRYRQYPHEAYRVILIKHLKDLYRVLVLFVLLFILSATGEVVRATGLSETTEVVLWAGFVMAAAVVNGWVLYLIRPREELTDAEVLEQSFYQFRRETSEANAEALE